MVGWVREFSVDGGLMNELNTDERITGWMENWRWMVPLMDSWKDVWVDRQVYGWIHVWMDGWMGGSTDY